MIVTGQPERATQNRVVALLRDELGYADQGNLAGRPDNRNIDAAALLAWLTGRGTEPAIAARAVAALETAANNATHDIYTRDRNVYELLRYGVPVKPAQGVNTVVVHLIDWKHPEANAFAVAEEVTVRGATTYANDKRPDVVLSVNGVVLGVLELKRSTVSVASGIRQNLDSQKREFVEPYFATVQLVMAGNDTRACATAPRRRRSATTSSGARRARPRTAGTGSTPTCAACWRSRNCSNSSTTSCCSTSARRSCAGTTSSSASGRPATSYAAARAASFGTRKAPARASRWSGGRSGFARTCRARGCRW